MLDHTPMLEYANKSTPGDSRPARRLIVLAEVLLFVIIVTGPLWRGLWEGLLNWIYPIVDGLTKTR